MTIWCSLEEAVATVKSGDRVFVQGACSTPTPLLEALVARGETLHDVEITHLHTYGPTPYTDERWEGHFRLRALFVSANTRAAVNSGRASYAPIFLSDIPALFASASPENGLPLDVAFLQVSPPDAHGYCSLGPSVDVTRAAVNHARHIIALVNPQVPRVHGEGFIPLERIAYAVRWDKPLYTVERALPDERPDATHARIGEQIATLIEDGATLQLGIGAIPDTPAAARRSSHEARAVLRGARADPAGLGRAGRFGPASPRACPAPPITDRDDDGTYHGTFQVKLGPTTAAYRGTIKIEERRRGTATAALKARGTDKRGQGRRERHDRQHAQRARRRPRRVVGRSNTTSPSPAGWRASAAAA